MKLRLLLIFFVCALSFFIGKTEIIILDETIYVSVARPFLAVVTFVAMAIVSFLTVGPVEAKQ